VPRFILSAFALLVQGCERAPESVSDCTALALPSSRDGCLQGLLQHEIGATELREAIAVASDPAIRDLLRLQLVVLEPWSAEQLCPEVESERAESWCRDIQARPHIWIRQRQGTGGP
jgi:hypothetical protein